MKTGRKPFAEYVQDKLAGVPDGSPIVMINLLRHRSKQAFLATVGSPEFDAITVHRTAALADSRLIATVPSG